MFHFAERQLKKEVENRKKTGVQRDTVGRVTLIGEINLIDNRKCLGQIRPRMYVRRSIMYEKAAFCSPEENSSVAR